MVTDTYPMTRTTSGSGLATTEAVERVLAAAGLEMAAAATTPVGDRIEFSDAAQVRLAKRRKDVEDEDETDDEEEEEGEEEDGTEDDEDEDEDFDEDDEEFEEEFEDDELDDDDDDIFYDDDDDE